MVFGPLPHPGPEFKRTLTRGPGTDQGPLTLRA